MPGFLANLFRADFMPHGYCFAWRPEILWLSVLSDGMITLAYTSIPLTLIYFVRHRRDLVFNWIFYMFGAFILLCGATHAMGIYVLWYPIYRAEVLLKLATGIVSISTAVMLVKLLPTALGYPAPADLEEANASLAALNLELEQKVEDRTRELAAARDVAERANRAKSDFIATMSHEIRTPLNGIIGNIDFLAETGMAAQASKIFDTIRLSSDALLSVINDVLDFSKIEAGKFTLDSAPFNPRRTLEEAVELSSQTARAKGLELRSSVAPDVPTLLTGDSPRLRQILLNLLSNAIKFTPEGKVECALSMLGTENGTTRLRYEVTDTGIGIGAAVQRHLFQPFSQADSSTTRRFGGTGLGLAISKRLTEMMGGEIGVVSAEGEGSRFWFTVALDVAEDPGDSGPFPAPVKPLEILLADDNAVNRMVIERALERLGCKVTISEDGQAAVDTVISHSFDAVLMDCHMPLLDGPTATERIRKAERESGRAPVPIIALTANVLPEVQAQCLAAGMNAFLTKPVEIETLAAELGRLLRVELGPPDKLVS